MTTNFIGVLVRGAIFEVGGARAFSGEIWSETPEITVIAEERLEERLVYNARPNVTTHSADPPTKLVGSV